MDFTHIPPAVADGLDISLDITAGTVGVGAVAAWWFNIVHGIEALVIGGLVIWLMALRIRSHLRRDRIDKQAGRQ